MIGVRASLQILFVSLWSLTARADPARIAIIVANNHAFDSALAELRYADDDGVAYASALAPYVERVELLSTLDDETQQRNPGLAAVARVPSRANLKSALDGARAFVADEHARGRRTEMLFVFVGHGSLDEQGRGYLHLADGRLTRADLFGEVIAGIPADRSHLIVDACHAFSTVAGRGATEISEEAARAALEPLLTGHELEAHPHVGVLLASSADQRVHEWSRIHAGVFSHLLRSALTGASDVNGDGVLEYSEVAAFVDAASTGLATSAAAFRVFAWPPPVDRHSALLNLRGGKETRVVVLAPPLAGRMSVEGEHGERWADLHKAAGKALALFVPARGAYYVRSALGEYEIRAGPNTETLSASGARPLTSSPRGAVEQAFEDNLFAVPFNDSYYLGYLAGHRQLLAVEANASALVPGEMPAAMGLRMAVAYAAATFLLDDPARLGTADVRPEHSISTRASYSGWRALTPSLTVEGSVTPLSDAAALRAVRLAVLPGIGVRARPHPGIRLEAGVDLGWGALALQTQDDASADPSVGLARARGEASIVLIDPFELVVGFGWTGALVSLDGAESARHSGGLFVGVAGQLGTDEQMIGAR